MIEILESVDLNEQEKESTARELRKIYLASKPNADELQKLADRARNFVLGNHSKNPPVSDGRTFSMARFRSMEDRNTPVVHLFPGEFAKMAGYVLLKQSKPYVVAEDRAMYSGDEDPLASIRGVLREAFPMEIGPDGQEKQVVTDSEIIASIMNARLDRWMEKVRFKRLLRMIYMSAAMNRVACVLVGYDKDETAKEPAYVALIPAGDFGWDDEAPTFAEGRYMWRRESNILASEVAKRYDGLTLQKVLEACSEKDHASNKDMPDSLKTVSLIHIWRRNDEMVEGEAIPGQPVEAVYRYRGGWQYTVMLDKTILFNGHSTTYNGAPPMLALGMWQLPESQFSVGMYDQIAPYNRVIDEMQGVMTEGARKSLTKVVVNTSKVMNPEAITDGRVKGVLIAKEGEDARTVIHETTGNGASTAIADQSTRLLATMRETLGTSSIVAEDMGRDASGVYLEGVKQDRAGIAALSAEDVDIFTEDLLTMVMQMILKYEDSETTLKVIGHDKAEHYLTLNMSVLAMKDSDFEANWDIRITRPTNEPDNPIKRAELHSKNVQEFAEVLGVDPELAEIWLEGTEIRQKQQLRALLRKRNQQAQAQAQNPEEAQPNEAMMKAQADIAKSQAESELKMREKAADAVADARERLATGYINAGMFKEAEAIINSMPADIEAAYNGAPQPVPGGPLPPDDTDPSQGMPATVLDSGQFQ